MIYSESGFRVVEKTAVFPTASVHISADASGN